MVKLDQSLAPGQTGCLLGGTYGNTGSVDVLGRSGSASGGYVTITSYPGQQAKLVGLIELEGSYTVLSGLEIDGSNTQYSSERPGTSCPYPVSNGLEIDGHNDVFQYNDFYQSVPSLRGNGIGIGWNGHADGTIIRYNRIHDLGQCQAYDQMIYLAQGSGVQIYDNWLWNDPHGWGVQVYPAASNADIYDNVIDGAGSGFVVGGSSSVSGNVIEHNVIMNSTGLPDAGLSPGDAISSSGGLGSGNVFQNNDLFNTDGGLANAAGISLTGNIDTNPGFENPSAHDYRVTTGSPLAGWSLWDGGLGAIAATVTAGQSALVKTAPAISKSRPAQRASKPRRKHPNAVRHKRRPKRAAHKRVSHKAHKRTKHKRAPSKRHRRTPKKTRSAHVR